MMFNGISERLKVVFYGIFDMKFNGISERIKGALWYCCCDV